MGTTAQAAVDTFTVNKFGDPATLNCTPDDCTLREAIEDSNDGDATDVDRIIFASNITGQITLNGSELPQILEPLEIAGPGAKTLTISGDDASRIFNVNALSGDDVTLGGLTVSHGDEPTDGGAITHSSGDLTIRDSVIRESSGNDGGGVYSSGDSLTIVRSTISGNKSLDDGAGIYAFSGSLAIRDSTISDNSGGDLITPTNSHGGGVFSDGNSAVTIESSTIAGNTFNGGGGGVYSRSSTTEPTLTNTIVADNSAGTSAPDLGSSGGTPDTFQLAFSLVEDPSDAPIADAVPGSNILGQDPGLGPLIDNGGSTPSRALPVTSLAVDAGMATGTDQRGTGRPFDIAAIPNATAAGANGADIGAFELNSQQRCNGRAETVLGNAGTPGPDVIVGTSGPDTIRGRGGKDLVCGGGDRDRLIGGGGRDTLRGEAGNDTLKGGPGRDALLGGAGKDLLVGGSGRDKLKGGPGRDRQLQ
jgi:CSLREA domain-containing protein